MTIVYDFIAFSGRLTENTWSLGMKALQGEVPLDIVIPNIHTSSDPKDEEIIGVLTKEGISRKSSDVMELYRYLRQLNPKSNQAFGYNEVAIRNIHTRLNSLQIDQELRVQITYTERKENYIPASYNIKLLGTFQLQPIDSPKLESELEKPQATQTEKPQATQTEKPQATQTEKPQATQTEKPEDNTPVIPKNFPSTDPEIPVYKTTNTLEKLIVFTRTLQSELNEAKKTIDLLAEKVQLLEEEREHYREQENLLQDILKRLDYLDSFEKRIDVLEDDRHQLDKLRQILDTYFRASNRQTQSLLKEVNDETDDINS